MEVLGVLTTLQATSYKKHLKHKPVGQEYPHLLHHPGLQYHPFHLHHQLHPGFPWLQFLQLVHPLPWLHQLHCHHPRRQGLVVLFISTQHRQQIHQYYFFNDSIIYSFIDVLCKI